MNRQSFSQYTDIYSVCNYLVSLQKGLIQFCLDYTCPALLLTELNFLFCAPVFYIKCSSSFSVFQNGPAPITGKSATKQKPQTRSLFSDDEDAQVRLSALEKLITTIYIFLLYNFYLYMYLPSIGIFSHP